MTRLAVTQSFSAAACEKSAANSKSRNKSWQIGVTPASVNKWFTGKSVPNLWMAVQIADILDLPMDEIFNPRPIAIDYMIPLSVSMESIEKSIDKMSKDQVRGLALLLRGYEIKR